ncbi:hypothetical protein [Streptomyces sp. HUAS TT7]
MSPALLADIVRATVTPPAGTGARGLRLPVTAVTGRPVARFGGFEAYGS